MRLPPRLLLILLLGSAAARADVAALREELAREKVRRVQAYLQAHPQAPDELAALNLLLDGHQELKQVEEMIPLLRRRYDLMRGDPQTALPALLDRTAVPLAQALASRHRRAEAVEFLGQVKADLAAHPAAAQIRAGLDQFIRQIRPPAPGDQPDFTVHELGGPRHVSAAELRGKIVQVEFWMSSCDLCLAQKDVLRIAHDRYAARGFAVVGLNRDEQVETAAAFLARERLPWINGWDLDPRHGFAGKLNVDFIPTSLLLDREGKVIALNLRGDALLQELEKRFPAP
jgi:hypothetical protein